MKSTTYFRQNLPELFLLLSTLFYVFSSVGFTVNPIGIVILLVLLAQVYFKNQHTGIALSSIFVLIFSYLFLALFSDLIKLHSLADGWEMLLFGTAYLGISLLASILMLKKYVTAPFPKKREA